MLDIYLIIILSLIISYSPFIKKILLQTFTLDEVIFLEHIFFTIPLVLYMVYMVFFTKKKIRIYKKIKCKSYLLYSINDNYINYRRIFILFFN